MESSPFEAGTAFTLGPVAITTPVVVTWAIMAVLTVASILMTRRLSLKPGRAQAVLELIVSTIVAPYAAFCCRRDASRLSSARDLIEMT